jgi:hypothetical protein
MARSGDWITAGDGLGAFGAALILTVQTHCRTAKITAGQRIYAKQRHARRDLQLINRPARFSSEYPTGRAAARGNLEPSPSPSTRAKARPPQPRESCPARHPTTGPGAEGGGGWPMQATAQPWHAEGRPLPTAAEIAVTRELQKKGGRKPPELKSPRWWSPWRPAACGRSQRLWRQAPGASS